MQRLERAELMMIRWMCGAKLQDREVEVCGIPNYGSESEVQKLNRAEPNYFRNSKRVGNSPFCLLSSSDSYVLGCVMYGGLAEVTEQVACQELQLSY